MERSTHIQKDERHATLTGYIEQLFPSAILMCVCGGGGLWGMFTESLNRKPRPLLLQWFESFGAY